MGEGKYSVAFLDWDEKPAVGMRWNGGKSEDGTKHPGTPQSRGIPTWWIVPDLFELPILIAVMQIGPQGPGIDVQEARTRLNQGIQTRQASISNDTSVQSDTQLNDSVEKAIMRIVVQMKRNGQI